MGSEITDRQRDALAAVYERELARSSTTLTALAGDLGCGTTRAHQLVQKLLDAGCVENTGSKGCRLLSVTRFGRRLLGAEGNATPMSALQRIAEQAARSARRYSDAADSEQGRYNELARIACRGAAAELHEIARLAREAAGRPELDDVG